MHRVSEPQKNSCYGAEDFSISQSGVIDHLGCFVKKFYFIVVAAPNTRYTLFNDLFFSCAKSLLLHVAFSNIGEWRLLFTVVLRLLIVVTSCCGAQALERADSVAVAHGLGCPEACVRSSLTRDRTRLPFIGRWIFNHRTTREVPTCLS